MWTRDLLKRNAKQVMSNNYWTAFLVCLVASLLAGGSGVTAPAFSLNYNFSPSYPSEGFDLFSSSSMLGTLLMAASGVAFFALILGIAFHSFVSNPVSVGKSRYFMENRVGNAPFTSLFSTFGGSAYMNVVKVMFMRDLFVFLWSLLFFFPGVYKAYQYRMVDYLLAENPYLSWQRALELSREMTQNEKLNIFVLDISFFGWVLLGAFVCGLGILFVRPYMETTYAELYAALRAKIFSSGITNASELGDFVRY